MRLLICIFVILLSYPAIGRADIFSSMNTYLKSLYSSEMVELEEPVEPWVQDLIDEIAQQFEITTKISAYKIASNSPEKRVAALIKINRDTDIIVLGDEFFQTITRDEQKFIIGHELIHSKELHSYWRLLVQWASPCVQYVLTKQLERRFYRRVHELYGEDAYNSYLLYGCVLAEELALNYVIHRILCRTFSRYLECRADRGSAVKLDLIDTAIGWFKKLKAQSSVIDTHVLSLWARYNLYMNQWVATHPTYDDRITSLEKMLTKSAV